MIADPLLDVLACPKCRGALRSERGTAECARCAKVFVRDRGVYRFVPDDDFYEGAYEASVNFVSDGSLRSELLLYLFNTHYLWYVRKYVPKGARLLELGCGGGVRFFAQHARATGLDLSFSSLRRLDPAYEGALQASALELPLASETFDAVVSAYFWEHIEPSARPQLLSEVARVLKPGGRVVFLFDVLSNNPLYRIFRRDASKFREDFVENDRHYGLEPATKNLQRFANAGFEVLAMHLANKSLVQHLPVYSWGRNYGRAARAAAAVARTISSSAVASKAYTASVTLFDDMIERFLPKDWARIMLVALEKR